jgi:hypothetical protein
MMWLIFDQLWGASAVGTTARGLRLVHAYIYAPVLPFVITIAAVATAAIVFRKHDAAREREIYNNKLNLLKEKS